MPRPETNLTGGWRYRRSLFGKMILQVEVRRHPYRQARVSGAGDTVWQDAGELDLRWLRAMLEHLKNNANCAARRTE